jgi:metallo-beta-lactamase class B
LQRLGAEFDCVDVDEDAELLQRYNDWVPVLLLDGAELDRAPLNEQTLRLGDTIVTAHATPGHTAGSMSWSWRSCAGDDCVDVVFAASLNAVSAEGYRFTDPSGQAIVATLRRSFASVRAMPCDLLITSHPDQSGIDARYRRFVAGERPNPLIDTGACRAYVDRAEQRLAARLDRESATSAPPGS